ncbi:MAG: hypothetical protein HY898_00390 [Deltaproteobacteria bacterium]|nr:hypothetical protein [Deltaproteobacteria bacterium]
MKVVNAVLGLFSSDRRTWDARHAEDVPVSALVAGTEARLTGIVEPEQPLVTSPFTQTQCVFWYARLEEKHVVDQDRGILASGARELVQWREAICQGSYARFWIRDASGARAHVDMGEQATCHFAFDPPNVSDHPRVNDENERLCTYLRSHGILPGNYMGIAGDTRFYEQCVLPGDRIAVFGQVQEHSVVQTTEYRDMPVKLFRFVGAQKRPLLILLA